MSMLRPVTGPVLQSLGLADPTMENQLQTPDRVTIGGSLGTTYVDQASVTAYQSGQFVPEYLKTSVDQPGSKEAQGQKFFLVWQGDWETTKSLYDTICEIDVAKQLFQSDHAVMGIGAYHTYARFNMEVVVQTNPTSFMAGGLMAAMVPQEEGYGSKAAYTMFPHCMINCNVNNSGRIKVNWVHTRGAWCIDSPVSPVWKLHIFCWSKLTASSNTSQKCTVSVLARFCELEVHGARPILSHMMRNEVRLSPASHVINLCNFQDARAKVSAAIAEEKSFEEPSVGAGVKITDFRIWTATPSLMSVATYDTGHDTGYKIWEAPVNPYYYTTQYKSRPYQFASGDIADTYGTTSLASVAAQFAYWRGDMVYYFQIFCTKYHSGRLLACFVPGNENTDTARLTLLKTTSCQSVILDINGVNTTVCFRIPWCSDTHYRCNKSVSSRSEEGKFSSTGKVVLMAFTKLTAPANVGQSVYINIYAAMENADFVGPLWSAPGLMAKAGDEPEANPVLPPKMVETSQLEQKPESDSGFTSVGYASPLEKAVASINEAGMMNEIPYGVATAIEDPMLMMKKPQTFPEADPGKIRHSADQMSVRNFMGRAHFYAHWRFYQTDGFVNMPIWLGEWRGNEPSNRTKAMNSTLRWFFSMVHLMRGSLDVTVIFAGAHDVDGVIWFTPNYAESDTRDWTEATDNYQSTDFKAAIGCCRFNTRRTGSVQIRLPYYSCLNALSGVVPKGCNDDIFGYLSIQLANYNKTDELVEASVYISLNEETECYFPRAPASFKNISTSGITKFTVTQQMCIESSVDDPRTPEDISFEKFISTGVDSPYKNPRLLVGEWRLKYAQEEWERKKMIREADKKKSKFSIFKKTQSVNDLTSNTGGILTDCVVVVQNAGGKVVRRGIHYEGKIYTTNLPTMLERMGPLSGKFVVEDLDVTWDSTGKSVRESPLVKWINYKFKEIRFSWSKFHKRKFIECFEVSDWKALNLLFSSSDLDLLLRSMSIGESSLVDEMLKKTKIGSDIQDTVDTTKQLTSECLDFLSQVKGGFADLLKTLQVQKYAFCFRTILNCAKLGSLIYLCTKLDLTSDLGTPALTLVALEVFSFSFDVTTSVVNMIAGFLAKILSDTKMKDAEVQMESQSILREVSSGVVIFKAVKEAFIWVLKRVKKLFDDHYGDKIRLYNSLSKHSEDLEELIALSDEYCTKQDGTESTSSIHSEGISLIKRLRTLISVCSRDDELKVYLTQIRDSLNRVHSKVKSLGLVSESVVVRAEPVVVFMSGNRGAGKSLAAMALAVKLCKSFGVDYKSNIYTHPEASEYWDGYNGQLICIMDDIGQKTDDEDWSNFCQLISTCPLRVNMAALEMKGRHFTSPIVICTSNHEKPDPKTVYVREAVWRRLHIKVRVDPKDYFKTTVSGIAVLNVEQAKREGAIKDMDCVSFSTDEGAYTLQQICDHVVAEVTGRRKNLEEFMELWANSNIEDDHLQVIFDDLPKPKSKIMRKLDSLLRFVETHPIVISSCVISLVVASVSLFAMFKTFKKNKKKTEAVYSGGPKPKNIVPLAGVHMESTSVLDLANLIHRNLMRFGTMQGDTVNWHVNALGVKDDWILVPSHAWKYDYPPDVDFIIQKGGVYYSTSSSAVEVLNLEEGNQDVVLMRIPGLPKCKNLVEHFVKKADQEFCEGKVGTLVTINGGIFQLISEGPLEYEEKAHYMHNKLDGGVEKINIGASWRGRGETFPGSCGGALISSNTKLQTPICGIHVASGGGFVLSKAIYREMFDIIEHPALHAHRVVEVRFVSTVVPLGSKTQFTKSPLFEQIGKGKINWPAQGFFKKSNEVEPFLVAMDKYRKPILEEPVGYTLSYLMILDRVLNYTPKPFKILTCQEAIKGIDGMDRMEPNSSPGLPWVLRGKKKRDLIDFDSGNIIDADLAESVTKMIQTLTVGGTIKMTYMSCPKDELRPIEKCLKGQTRVIEACPVDFTIVARCVWGNVIGQLQQRFCWDLGIAIGIDPDSDWHPLFTSAMRFADEGIDIDFRQFDSSVQPFMVFAAVRILCEASGLSEEMFKSMYYAIAYCWHQIGSIQYKTVGSMPSGAPCTSLLNSLANLVNCYWALSDCCQKTPFAVSKVFKVLVYGDDAIILIKRGCKLEEGFLEQLTERFARLGLEVTSSMKGPLEIVPVLQLEFLKRQALVDIRGKIHPAIRPHTIWSLLAWKREKAKFVDNLEDACWFAYHHGPAFYARFQSFLKEALKMACVEWNVPQFYELEARFDDLCHLKNLWKNRGY